MSKKLKIVIDEIISEEGEPIYFVGRAESITTVCKLCDSGYFVSEEALNEWLLDHKEQVEIIEDWRG